MDKLTLSVYETATILGIGTTRTYQALRSGKIPSIKFGRRYIISRIAIEGLIQKAFDEGCPPIKEG